MKFETKKAAQRWHACFRAAQRHGLILKRADLDALVREIQSGKAEFYDRQSLRCTRWVMDVKGRRVIVVYDTKRKTIVTFLHAKKNMLPAELRKLNERKP